MWRSGSTGSGRWTGNFPDGFPSQAGRARLLWKNRREAPGGTGTQEPAPKNRVEHGNGEVETMTATVLGALRANTNHVIIPAPAISTH